MEFSTSTFLSAGRLCMELNDLLGNAQDDTGDTEKHKEEERSQTHKKQEKQEKKEHHVEEGRLSYAFPCQKGVGSPLVFIFLIAR